MPKSILFIGDMMFDLAMHNGNVINDEDVYDYEDEHDVEVECVTYVTSLDLVISHEDADFLCDVGEDYITGQNETGMNPNNIQCDSYFVDTEHDENIYTHDQLKFYAPNEDGKFVVFDNACKFIYGCDTEEELLVCFPTAKKMTYTAQLDTKE